MKTSAQGYRVAIVGASSLLGKELVTVLEERRFPVSQLITVGVEASEPDLPIIDLSADFGGVGEDLARVAFEEADAKARQAEVDFAFLANRSPQSASFLDSPESERRVVIDLGENLGPAQVEEVGGRSDEVLSVPFLDRVFSNGSVRDSKRFVSAHPAAIVISSLLLRLASRFQLRRAVGHVFGPASEIGPRAIEELQKQTVNVLSFQKFPQSVFGAQLAFNLLPRLGRARRGESQPYRDDLTYLEGRLRAQLRTYLRDRVPLPALRVIQVPVFYSLTVSLYVETAEPPDLASVGQALAGDRVLVRRLSDQAPSQINVTGTSDILVDAITADAEHPAGIWLWAAADNIRLAAVNAVEIAESLKDQGPPQNRRGTEKSHLM
ncbi:MAG: hypothetical protein DMG26_15535 [Acidobacteria bacterium]|nr:MAG: hypothetical protein DMG26_15535 [Acidobacteriota bacterium]